MRDEVIAACVINAHNSVATILVACGGQAVTWEYLREDCRIAAIEATTFLLEGGTIEEHHNRFVAEVTASLPPNVQAPSSWVPWSELPPANRALYMHFETVVRETYNTMRQLGQPQ